MITEIWKSFRRLPLWVQAWIALGLVPVNMAALVFLDAPMGNWVAVLAVGGLALNLPIMLRDRGFSKAMALPHVLVWTPLMILLSSLLTGSELTDGYRTYLWILLAVDLTSLGFDYADALRWWKGDRGVA